MIETSVGADGLFVAAVLMMTAVTYMMRAGGYWVMGRIPLTTRVRKALESLPGAIIVSTILPIAFKGGVPVVLCIIVSGTAMSLLRKDIIAVVCAVAAAAAARAYGF